MKLVYLCFAAIFLLFSAVQINDPDPFYWMFIYMSAGVLCFLAFLERFYPKITLVFWGGYALTAIGLFGAFRDWLFSDDRSMLFDEFAKMQYPYVEETREFLGLVIVLIAMSVLYYQTRKQNA